MAENTAPVAAKTRLMVVIGSLHIGGAQKHVYDLLRTLPHDEYEFHVVTFMPGGFYYDKVRELGATIHTLHIAGRIDLLIKFPAFLRLVRSIQPQLMHLFLFYSSLYGARAATVLRRPPVVIYSKRSMGLDIGAFRRFVYRHVVLPRADAITAVTVPVAEECMTLGAQRELICVVENGIEWTSEPERGHLRKAIGLDGHVPLVGMVGSMTPRKRQHLMIEAAPAILRTRPDTHFVILGDGPLRRQLEDRVKQLGVADRVHLPGVLAPAVTYLADLSVFLLTSSEEGTSNALLEAMMIGIPVVCSDIPSNRQVVVNGEHGLLVGAGIPDLARAVANMLERTPEVDAMVERARRRVAARYRLDACAAVNASLYSDLIRSRQEGRQKPAGLGTQSVLRGGRTWQ